MDIYWIQDHEKKGPLPEVEVISMLEAGKGSLCEICLRFSFVQ